MMIRGGGILERCVLKTLAHSFPSWLYLLRTLRPDDVPVVPFRPMRWSIAGCRSHTFLYSVRASSMNLSLPQTNLPISIEIKLKLFIRWTPHQKSNYAAVGTDALSLHCAHSVTHSSIDHRWLIQPWSWCCTLPPPPPHSPFPPSSSAHFFQSVGNRARGTGLFNPFWSLEGKSKLNPSSSFTEGAKYGEFNQSAILYSNIPPGPRRIFSRLQRGL